MYKGIFWIIDLESLDNKLVFKISVDFKGNIKGNNIFKLNSKKHNNYNHKKTWEELSEKKYKGKSYDYYPRGRVEINNCKATIYANPNICTDTIMAWIIDEFGLYRNNGIKKISIITDHSKHYRCYMDY